MIGMKKRPGHLRGFLLYNIMNNIILIIVGGGLGALARYGCRGLLESFQISLTFNNISLNTMIINIIGSCLFGLFLYMGKIFNLSDSIKLLFLTGFLSSFTTYSTFVYELSDLIHNRNIIYAGSYLILSIAIPVFIMLFFLSKI